MKFKDTTNNQGLISDIDFLIWGNGTLFHDQYSMEDRTRNINIAYSEAIVALLKADPNWMWDDSNRAKNPIGTTDLNAGKAQYSFPDSMISIHRVRVKNRQGEYKTLDPTSRREISDGELNDTGIPNKYYKIDNVIYLVPEPDYSASEGLEVQMQREPEYFEKDDTDKEPGFSGLSHQFLSVSAAYRYAYSNDMPEKAQFLKATKEELIDELENHYQGRADDKMPNISPKKTNIKHYGIPN